MPPILVMMKLKTILADFGQEVQYILDRVLI